MSGWFISYHDFTKKKNGKKKQKPEIDSSNSSRHLVY